MNKGATPGTAVKAIERLHPKIEIGGLLLRFGDLFVSGIMPGRTVDKAAKNTHKE